MMMTIMIINNGSPPQNCFHVTKKVQWGGGGDSLDYHLSPLLSRFRAEKPKKQTETGLANAKEEAAELITTMERYTSLRRSTSIPQSRGYLVLTASSNPQSFPTRRSLIPSSAQRVRQGLRFRHSPSQHIVCACDYYQALVNDVCLPSIMIIIMINNNKSKGRGACKEPSPIRR